MWDLALDKLLILTLPAHPNEEGSIAELFSRDTLGVYTHAPGCVGDAF